MLMATKAPHLLILLLKGLQFSGIYGGFGELLGGGRKLSGYLMFE